MRFLVPSLLILTVGAASAAEMHPDLSIRLGFDGMPKSAEMSSTATDGVTSVTTTSSDDWDTGGRLYGGLYWSDGRPVSLYVGAGIAATGWTYKKGTLEETLSEAGVFLEPGIKVQVNQQFAIEAGAILGAGSANYTEKDVGYKIDGSGYYGEIGFVVRPMLVLERVLIFAEGGYVHNAAHIDDTPVDGMPGITVSGDIDTSGGFFGVGLGLRI